MSDFFHRVEVRDITGETASILFSPDQGSLDFRQLQTGSTVFVRYATKCYFSDLMTQVLKVENLDFVKVIACGLDMLLCFSQYYYSRQSHCNACGREINSSVGVTCSQCRAATYCSADCQAQHSAEHKSHCGLCQELGDVLNVDFERFLSPVPFR